MSISRATQRRRSTLNGNRGGEDRTPIICMTRNCGRVPSLDVPNSMRMRYQVKHEQTLLAAANVPEHSSAVLAHHGHRGTRTRSLCSIARLKAGVSARRRRTYRPTKTRSALARKGRRQPHESTRCRSGEVVSHRNVPEEQMNPMGAPSWGNIPYNACLPGGAFSVASTRRRPIRRRVRCPVPNVAVQEQGALLQSVNRSGGGR